jgi:hypothetical protein
MFLRLRPTNLEAGSTTRASVVSARIEHESTHGLWLAILEVKLPDGQLIRPAKAPVFYLRGDLMGTARLFDDRPSLDARLEDALRGELVSRGRSGAALRELGCGEEVADGLARLIEVVEQSNVAQQLPLPEWRTLTPRVQDRVRDWLRGRGFVLAVGELAPDATPNVILRKH